MKNKNIQQQRKTTVYNLNSWLHAIWTSCTIGLRFILLLKHLCIFAIDKSNDKVKITVWLATSLFSNVKKVTEPQRRYSVVRTKYKLSQPLYLTIYWTFIEHDTWDESTGLIKICLSTIQSTDGKLSWKICLCYRHRLQFISIRRWAVCNMHCLLQVNKTHATLLRPIDNHIKIH